MKDLEKVKNAKRRREDFAGKAAEMEDANRELEKNKRDDETKTEEEPYEKKSKEEQASGSGTTEEQRRRSITRSSEEEVPGAGDEMEIHEIAVSRRRMS